MELGSPLMTINCANKYYNRFLLIEKLYRKLNDTVDKEK